MSVSSPRGPLPILRLVRHENIPALPAFDWLSQGYTYKDAWVRPNIEPSRQYTLRFYDAVGPETMSMLEMQRRFASLNGRTLRPVTSRPPLDPL
eukprot:1494275-Pyramimonas_sp.AAC.1